MLNFEGQYLVNRTSLILDTDVFMVLLTLETIVRHYLPNNLGKNVQIIASVIFCSILYVMKAFHHLTTDLLPLMFFTDIKCGGTNTAVLHGNTNGAICTVGLLVK